MAEKRLIVDRLLAERRATRGEQNPEEVDSRPHIARMIISLLSIYSETETALDDADMRLRILGDREDITATRRREALEDVVMEAYREQRRTVAELEKILPLIDASFFHDRVDRAASVLESIPRFLRLHMPGYVEAFEVKDTEMASVNGDSQSGVTKVETEVEVQ